MKNKKRILSGLLAAALVVPLFAGSAQTAAAAEAAGKTLDVVFTHDTHSHLNSFSLSLIHISEPTRQAEISYAVFCLKKKKKKTKKK